MMMIALWVWARILHFVQCNSDRIQERRCPSGLYQGNAVPDFLTVCRETDRESGDLVELHKGEFILRVPVIQQRGRGLARLLKLGCMLSLVSSTRLIETGASSDVKCVIACSALSS
jgi:hypothetical protein